MVMRSSEKEPRKRTTHRALLLGLSVGAGALVASLILSVASGRAFSDSGRLAVVVFGTIVAPAVILGTTGAAGRLSKLSLAAILVFLVALNFLLITLLK